MTGIASIPRLIMLVGYNRCKGFGLLDQFLAYQCQANRFVAMIKNAAPRSEKAGNIFGYDYMITEINQAYLQCTLIGSLQKTVAEILKTYQSDFIILEESGAGDLIALIHEMSELNELIRFDSLTAVIDSFTAERTLETSQEAQLQVRYADIVLLDKKELLNEISVQHLVRVIREFNTHAPIISIKSRSFDPSLVYGINLLNYNDSAVKEGPIEREGSEYDGIYDQLRAVRCEVHHPLIKNRFLKEIEKLTDKVFRIEGIVRFRDERFPVHLQYVGGRFDIRSYPNPAFKDQFMVVVAKNLGSYRFSF
jgi:G3E family GTPase